jgi:hypothetical protein
MMELMLECGGLPDPHYVTRHIMNSREKIVVTTFVTPLAVSCELLAVLPVPIGKDAERCDEARSTL